MGRQKEIPLRATVREQGLAQRMLKGSAMAAENQGDNVHYGAIRQKETRDSDVASGAGTFSHSQCGQCKSI